MKRVVSIVFAMALAGTASANQTDTNFLDGMTMHHKHGIDMARIAAQKASSSELRALAQKMIDDQEKDLRDFERMRDGAIQDDRPELADMPGMVGMDMKWLEAKSGREFDRAFAISMIDHHLGGIKMVDMETSRGARDAVKAKAREIRTKQRGDITRLARHK